MALRLRALHAWTGVLLSLLFALIGLAGAATALRPELIKASIPAARASEASPSSLGAALERFELSHPGELQSVKVSPYGLGVHRAYLKGGRSAYLDASGAEVASWSGNTRIEDAVLALHHTLFLKENGERLVGVLGIVGLAMVFVGVIIWWPARKSFSLKLAPASLKRRELLSSHRNLGVVIAAILVFQFTTGAVLVFQGPLVKLVGAPAPKVGVEVQPSRDWSKVVASASTAFPGAPIRRIFAPRKPSDPFVVYVAARGELNPEGVSRVYVSGLGDIVGTYDARKAPLGQRLIDSALGLHSGDVGGTGLRWLLAVGGLGLCLLSLAGSVSFIQKRKR